MVLGRVEEIVGETMPLHVAKGLRREIVHWHHDNRRAIADLLVAQNHQ
jgi:hypothetical protein